MVCASKHAWVTVPPPPNVKYLLYFENTMHIHTHTHTQQADLAQLYLKAGLKNIGTVFLLTDAQVPDEKFLVLINDLLASGEIPDLFAGVCVCVCVCACVCVCVCVCVYALMHFCFYCFCVHTYHACELTLIKPEQLCIS